MMKRFLLVMLLGLWVASCGEGGAGADGGTGGGGTDASGADAGSDSGGNADGDADGGGDAGHGFVESWEPVSPPSVALNRMIRVVFVPSSTAGPRSRTTCSFTSTPCTGSPFG